MRHVSDIERRARLGSRHALAGSARVGSPEAATQALTVLHATEPATVYLSLWARVNGLAIADVDRALYEERTLVKQLAMRRTLFVFPRALLAAALPSASARVAGTERARMAKDVVTVGITTDGPDWVDRVRAAVLAELEQHPEGRTATELRLAVPLMDVKVEPPGSDWWASPRILVQLGATGDIVRGTNTGHWRTSRPRWTLAARWLGGAPERIDAASGYRELVRRWLYTFGPGTENDIVWWLGATKGIVRTALAELEAVAVSLDGDVAGTGTGWMLPDDLDEVGPPEPWAALLPVLDPTVMGWKGRDFYLGPHSERLFEQRGNAGTTAWVNGRIVGCWVQDPAGVVRLSLVEEVSPSERSLLDAEAARLSAWLDGEIVATLYVSPAMRQALADLAD